jgi:hypothetical protein
MAEKGDFERTTDVDEILALSYDNSRIRHEAATRLQTSLVLICEEENMKNKISPVRLNYGHRRQVQPSPMLKSWRFTRLSNHVPVLLFPGTL